MTTHRINCLEVEIHARDVDLARQLIERVSLLRERRIVPVLDRVCSDLAGPPASSVPPGLPEPVDRIDRLELDLGVIAADDFDHDFIRKLEAALRHALAGRLARGRGLRPSEQPQKASRELLEAFARTGNLPWWADRGQPRLIAAHIRVLLEAPSQLLGLFHVLAGDAPALARLARHWDDPLLGAMVERLHPAGSVELLAGIHQLLRLFSGTGPAAAARARGVVLAVLARDHAGEPQSMLRAMVHQLAEPRALARLAAGDPAHPVPSWLRRALEDAGVPLASAADTVPAQPVPAQRPPVPVPAEPPLLRAARARALAALDQLYVDDAGLVILWPFLDRFFARTGLLDERRSFVDEQALMQAVALLEQLAILDPEPPEFCLPLAKILCGLPPQAPVALERPLAPEQLGECERLLAAVIEHAPILRDMPVAAFRATFLQRPGVLRTRDGAWLLQVERHPHDLVLDRFPWSWSWIKLPWMPEPLRVEW